MSLLLRLPRHAALAVGLALGLAFATGAAEPTAVPAARSLRLMAVGDSITAGADFFSCYRYPLWEKLFAAGYVVEFVGTQRSATRVGPLAHEGYGGKNTEFLAQTVPAHFREHPADVVLLHSGHNHTVEEQPIPGIVAATERLIAEFRAVNPRVTVLLAQVIPAGKLPKYAYIPELNTALAELAGRLDTSTQRVVPVDQATGFDWTTDTVTDKVHPNARGAEKMAAAWFETLKTVLPPPARAFSPKPVAYKTPTGSAPLMLHVFAPARNPAPAGGGRPAIVFFFGGGWTHGTPVQLYPECAHFSDRGFVAISADYRIASTHRTTPFESAEDARDALRWVRAHAAELGVDPMRIVLGGASAGGHLAAVTALKAGNEERPAALLLLYPALDTGPQSRLHASFGERFAELSPLHLLSAAATRVLPPTLILVGTADTLTPVQTARAFQAAAQGGGERCDVVTFAGAGHPIYAYREGGGPLRAEVLAAADAFFASLAGFR
ncbi:MAG TPA: alpha/beta hydrolase fold domain-containing protein [Opitutaceae bacterium]